MCNCMKLGRISLVSWFNFYGTFTYYGSAKSKLQSKETVSYLKFNKSICKHKRIFDCKNRSCRSYELKVTFDSHFMMKNERVHSY